MWEGSIVLCGLPSALRARRFGGVYGRVLKLDPLSIGEQEHQEAKAQSRATSYVFQAFWIGPLEDNPGGSSEQGDVQMGHD